MFKNARIKLTITYCVIFFSLFWIFSLSLYTWMEHSFGEGYVAQVETQNQTQLDETLENTTSPEVITVAGDVALAKLKDILLMLNGAVLIIIPLGSWVLTERTLKPVEKAYNAQKQFVSDAAHELRTPLTIVQGEFDVALNKTRKVSAYKTTLKSAREEIARLQHLTEDLLMLARGDRLERANFKNVDIIDVITESVLRFRPQARKKSIVLIFEPPHSVLRTLGYESQLTQVIHNLLDNAIKYTENGGRITLNVLSQKESIQIIVEDTGVGLTDSEIKKVTDRFYRADSSRSSQGFGLGLSICKSIIEQHNGTLHITSKEGVGTKVSVFLPKV